MKRCSTLYVTRHKKIKTIIRYHYVSIILSGVISPLISSSILGTYRPGEFLFQYPIILAFHTVHGVKGTTEDEIARWHHQLEGHEFEKTLGVADGQGGLACCDSWGCKKSDTTERLNWPDVSIKMAKIQMHEYVQ